MSHRWVVCTEGKGYLHDQGKAERRVRKFKDNALGLVKGEEGEALVVWLIGTDEIWVVPADRVKEIDITKTGDQYQNKICNICHCLLPVDSFAKNQTQKEGRVIRRPTCKACRTDIDKRPPKSRQAKQMEKERPAEGDPFKCHICQKRSIVGVTAKIVADHNHHTGDIRDYICDSCNTGLGRFQDDPDLLYNAMIYLRERDNLYDMSSLPTLEEIEKM